MVYNLIMINFKSINLLIHIFDLVVVFEGFFVGYWLNVERNIHDDV